MSAVHVAWAFEQQGLSPMRKFVLVALADRCNKDTLRCDPSIKRLAQDTGMDEGTVSRSLQELEANGFLERGHRQRENGSHRSTQYLFPGVTVAPLPRQAAPLPPGTVPPLEPEVRTRTKEPLAAAPRPKPSREARDAVWDTLTD